MKCDDCGQPMDKGKPFMWEGHKVVEWYCEKCGIGVIEDPPWYQSSPTSTIKEVDG